MRPTSWQVHGLLFIVPRRRGTERCECFYRHYKNQKDDTVCGLVSDWIQGILEYDLKSWEGLGDFNHIKENKKKTQTTIFGDMAFSLLLHSPVMFACKQGLKAFEVSFHPSFPFIFRLVESIFSP